MPRKQMFVSQSTSSEADTWEKQIAGKTFVFRVTQTAVFGQMPHYKVTVHEKENPLASLENIFINKPTREQVENALCNTEGFRNKFNIK